MRGKRILTTALLVALVAAPAVVAQGSGRIEGQVTQSSGAGLGGVVVVVNETGAVALTDANGNYSIGGVPAGDYSLSFTLGDNATNVEGVEVTAGRTARVDQSVDWRVSFAETITVVSASRRVERITEAPSAVTIVSEKEIEQEAAHGQLPKLLEFTPGAEVTQSGLYDYNFNTRGFNSSLNRRVATLVDGRNPSVPFLGAQEWAAVSFPLDDLAAAELVRGPSAALYGANASSGVLNLITKQPRYSKGGLFRLTGGEVSTLNADFRWAGGLGSDWYGKLLAGTRSSGDFTVSRRGQAEYTRPCGGGVTRECLPQEGFPLNPEDDNEILFGGARIDKYIRDGAAVFTAEVGTAEIEGPVFQTGIGRVQLVEVERPWARFNFNTGHWNVLAYQTTRDAPRQTALASGANLVLETERTGIEVQTNWSFADDRARIVIGASTTEEEVDTFDPRTGRQSLMFRPVTTDNQAVFGQLDWNLSDRVKLVLAGRYDESDLHDSQISPKASLVYSINPSHTLRFTYNEAFQVPNYSEFFLQAPVAAPIPLNALVRALAGIDMEAQLCAPFGVNCGFTSLPVLALGNKDLDVEEVQTFEVGYSGILAGKTFLTIDYYNSDNQNFITDLIPQLGTALGRVNRNFGPYQPPSALPGPVQGLLVGILQQALQSSFFILSNNLDGSPLLAAASYANFGEVDTQGIDVGLNHYLDDNWTISWNASWFDFDIKSNLPGFDQILLPNSPETKTSFGVSYAKGKWDGSLDGRWVDDFQWAVGPFQGTVKSYTTFDLSGNLQATERVKVGINVANLLDDEHWESFGGDLLARRALGHVTFTW